MKRGAGEAEAPGGWIGRYLRDPSGALRELIDRLTDLAAGSAPIAGPVAAVTIALVLTARTWWLRRRHTRLAADARLVTVLAPPRVDPAGGVALWSNLIGLLRPAWRRRVAGQPHLVFEYLFAATGAAIRIWVPGRVPPGLVERAVQAAWPGAHTHTTAAEPPFPTIDDRRHVVAGGELRLARPDALPIRTDADTDPIRPLFGAAAGMAADELACVQLLARPVTGRRLRVARRAARHVTAGRSPRAAGRLLDLITPTPTATRRPGAARGTADPQTALEHTLADRAIVAKQRGPRYETVVRYATTSTSADRAAVADRVRGKAHALAAAFAGYADLNHYRRHRLRHATRALAQRRLGRGDLLSVPELAALAHLPTDENVLGLQRAGAQAVAPPPGIPSEGPDVKPLGTADTTPPRPVGLAAVDARHHVHVLGATGSGKSTLMAQMILADAAAGRGVLVVDPKGDLVTDVLTRLPEHQLERVVVFDPAGRARPPCLNPLDGEDTDSTVDHLVSVFRRVYAAAWGPRTDDILRAASLTLRAQPGVATLTDLPRLLTDAAYRGRATRAITDPILRGFWTWYDDLSDPARAQAVAPLMNKLRGLLLRPFVRDALAGGPSTVDMANVLDGGICLVRIPKGTLGNDTTQLIGSLLVARAWQATTARAGLRPSRRRDAAMYIDECQSFLNLAYPIEDMLAEARGFHVSLVLAHQHLAQLGRELYEGISTNARNKIYFTAGPDDARDLARHTAPRLTEHDLAHLGAYHAAARLVVNGQQTEPFTLTTRPLPPPVRRIGQLRRRKTRQRTGETPQPTRSTDPRRST